jgi:hypothetical protein
VSEFVALTGVTAVTATEWLKRTSFNLERAVDMYYANNNKKSKAALEQFFNSLANNQPTLTGDSLLQLMSACDSSPADPVWLAVAYQCGAKEAGSFTMAEWIQGMRKLPVECGDGCADLAALKKALNALRPRCVGKSDFAKNLYRFAFTYSLEPGVRNLKLEDALVLWELLLKPLHWPLFDHWVSFISSRGSVVTKDTWNMVFELATTVHHDLSNFDPAGAWPVAIDDFVERVRNGGGDNTMH